jgi:hypothetical protein
MDFHVKKRFQQHLADEHLLKFDSIGDALRLYNAKEQ